MTEKVAAIWYDTKFWCNIYAHQADRGQYTRVYVDDQTLLLKCERVSSETAAVNDDGDTGSVQWFRYWIDDYFCVYTVMCFGPRSNNFRVKSSYRSLYGSTTMDEVEHILALALLQKGAVEEADDGE